MFTSKQRRPPWRVPGITILPPKERGVRYTKDERDVASLEHSYQDYVALSILEVIDGAVKTRLMKLV